MVVDMLAVTVVDDRDDKTIPPVDTDLLDVDCVVEALNIHVDEEHPLTITVYVSEGAKQAPTSFSHASSEGLQDWHLHLLLRPKRELTAGSIRAINRAISREVWKIKMLRDEMSWLEAHELEEVVNEQTHFADVSPQALKIEPTA